MENVIEIVLQSLAGCTAMKRAGFCPFCVGPTENGFLSALNKTDGIQSENGQNPVHFVSRTYRILADLCPPQTENEQK